MIRIRGFDIHKGYLDAAAQRALMAEVSAVITAAPPVRPMTPWGRPMSVAMTSAGRVGWVSGRGGYAYVDRHPSGADWPPIPPAALEVWRRVAGSSRDPECCLVNFYGPGARMGLHQDRDEADFSQPVVSISLGDDALFRMGNATRGGRTESVWLSSGDVVVMGGDARLTYHGIDRIRPGSSTVVPGGGRVNLTLRVVS